MADAVIKPKGDNYDTSDQMMCEVLLMAGHKASSVTPGGDGQLIYSFKIDEVWPIIENILTGKADDMMFSYANWWKAKTTWQMNLRHLSQSRKRRT